MSQAATCSPFPRLRARRAGLGYDGWNRLGDQTQFYAQHAAGHLATRSCTTEIEMVRLIAQMSLGTGALAVIGGTIVIVGFLTLSAGSLIAHPGLQPAAGGRRRGADRVRLGLPQRPPDRAAGRRHRAGRHDRRGRHRATGRDAHQRRDRRARGDGHPLDRLPGVHPCHRRRHRRHSAVLRRGAHGVPRDARRTTAVYGQSTGVYDHYFNTFLNPRDLDLVVPAGDRDGGRHHAGPHLLRLHRHGWSRRCRRGGRACRARLPGRRRVRHVVRLTGHLRPVRQLQPVGVARWRSGQRAWERSRLHPAWWTLILLAAIAAARSPCTSVMFAGTFTSSVPVTLTSDRAGLVMETGAKVKMRGVQVGGSRPSWAVAGSVSLKLEIDPDQVKYIPANVGAEIRATTAFGAKYVDLIYPDDPSPKRLAPGQVLRSQNVSTEVNTVFENLVERPAQDRPGQAQRRADGARRGSARSGRTHRCRPSPTPTRCCWRSIRARHHPARLAGAQGLQRHLRRRRPRHPRPCSTPRARRARPSPINASNLDALLLNVIGFSHSGIDLLGPNKDNLVNAINVLEPTTSLLMKYNPELTCMLVGRQELSSITGFGRRPAAATEVARSWMSRCCSATTRTGTRTICRSTAPRVVPAASRAADRCPIVAKNWPVRYLVTNTGWGTGVDVRPNPGHRIPRVRQLLPGDSRGCPNRPASGPGPACARTDSVPRRAAVRRPAVRAGRHPAVSGPAACAATLAQPRDPDPRRARSRSFRSRQVNRPPRCGRRRRRHPTPPAPGRRHHRSTLIHLAATANRCRERPSP